MATVNLGRIKFVWQGAYSGATAYVADDVVSYNGSSYICILASTGNLPTNATYWSLMAQSGTDITSIAGLAQGDVLYYNGTSWVRLGAGTSGQFLKTNGSGANPSWGTVSSDFVKLGETKITSAVSQIDFTSLFTTSNDYIGYKFMFSDLHATTNAMEHHLRFIRSGSPVTSSNYRWTVDVSYHNGSSAGTSESGGYNTDYARSFSQDQSNDTNAALIGEITFLLPNKSATTASTVSNVYFFSTHSHFGNGAGIRAGNAGGYLNDSSGTVNGVRFYPSSGNYDKGLITYYGIK